MFYLVTHAQSVITSLFTKLLGPVTANEGTVWPFLLCVIFFCLFFIVKKFDCTLYQLTLDYSGARTKVSFAIKFFVCWIAVLNTEPLQ